MNSESRIRPLMRLIRIGLLIPFALSACVKEENPWKDAEKNQQAPATLFAESTPLQMGWDDLLEEAKRLTQDKRIEEAEKLWKACMAEAEKFGIKDPRYASTLNEQAYFYYMTANNAKAAEETFKRLAEVRKEALGPDDPEVAWDILKIANLCSFYTRFDEADVYFKQALAIMDKNPQSTSGYRARILKDYAINLRKAKRDAEAAEIEKLAGSSP